MRKMNENYYKSNYGKSFKEKQKEYFENYLNGIGGFEKRINTVIELVKKHSNGKDVLDIGCGVGTFALLLARLGYNTKGIDISEDSIETCEYYKKKLKIHNVSFIKENLASKSEILEEKFDIIIAADIIEHLSDDVLKKTLLNCRKWLKNDGIVVIHTFPTIYQYQTVTSLSLTLLPIMFLPEKYKEKYLKFIHYTIYNLASLVIFKKPIDKYIKESGHCNPPHPFEFKSIVKSTGFKIKEYKLLDFALSPLSMNQVKFKFVKEIIKKNPILAATILTVLEK